MDVQVLIPLFSQKMDELFFKVCLTLVCVRSAYCMFVLRNHSVF